LDGRGGWFDGVGIVDVSAFARLVVAVGIVSCGPGTTFFVVEGAEGATDGGFVDGVAVAVGGEEVVADFGEEESCHFGGCWSAADGW
jgi:hypothetical protein